MNKDILILPDTSLYDAMHALDSTSEKVMLVVDDKKYLLGSLTDGDLRRHILKNNDLEGNIESIYNKDPIFVYESENNIKLIRKMFIDKKIELIPVINRERIVVDYITWAEAFKNHNVLSTIKRTLSTPVVIMAGGKGTRLDPLTRILPKPLIPIGNSTIIELIIDKFLNYNVSNFYLSVNHKSEIIKAYFKEKTLKYNIEFIEEKIPLGTAGGLRPLIQLMEQPFFVTNCDIILEIDYAELLDFHMNNGSSISLVASMKNYSIPYGVCEISSDGELAQIREKPKSNLLVNTGLYILSPEVLRFIPENEEYHMTNLIRDVKANDLKVGVIPVSENSWIDIGEWAEFKKTLESFRIG